MRSGKAEVGRGKAEGNVLFFHFSDFHLPPSELLIHATAKNLNVQTVSER